jgi:hypothetical protein
MHHRRREVVAVAVLVGDVLDEQHEEDIVLVLAGIHAAAQFVAGGPEGGIEVGFLDGHERASWCCDAKRQTPATLQHRPWRKPGLPRAIRACSYAQASFLAQAHQMCLRKNGAHIVESFRVTPADEVRARILTGIRRGCLRALAVTLCKDYNLSG